MLGLVWSTLFSAADPNMFTVHSRINRADGTLAQWRQGCREMIDLRNAEHGPTGPSRAQACACQVLMQFLCFEAPWVARKRPPKEASGQTVPWGWWPAFALCRASKLVHDCAAADLSSVRGLQNPASLILEERRHVHAKDRCICSALGRARGPFGQAGLILGQGGHRLQRLLGGGLPLHEHLWRG